MRFFSIKCRDFFTLLGYRKDLQPSDNVIVNKKESQLPRAGQMAFGAGARVG